MRSFAAVTLTLLLAAPGTLHAQAATTRAAPGLGTQQQPMIKPTLPALPPLLPTSPKNQLIYVDRFEVGVDEQDYPSIVGAPVVPQEVIIPSQLTGTGFDERIFVHIPSSYDSEAGPVPLVVAYHGFGASAASVGNQTTIDEHCEARGWLYLSVTGLDDKLFGTPLAQQHVDVAIQYMLDGYAIDADRIYMVGFSMGAGIVTNYAARHRDPAGIMIAAVATVSGSFDWTTTWVSDPAVQAWMLNVYNFGGSPTSVPFSYQRSSTLYFQPGTYPPYPGVHVPDIAMATNLTTVPVYVTWDIQDTIPNLPFQSATLVALLATTGGDVQARQVSGTFNPANGQQATHSWAVLDPFELFDFFDGKTVDRNPVDLAVQTDRSARAGWIEVVQQTTGAFSWFDARSDSGRLTIEGVRNVADLRVHVEDTASSGAWPMRLTATSADAAGFVAHVVATDADPGWFVDATTKALIQGQVWDPGAPSVGASVPASGTLDVRTWPATWGGELVITPDPVALGQAFTIDSSVTAGAYAVWLVINLTEAFYWAPNGHRLLVSPTPPALILPLLVGADGAVSWGLTMPPDPGLAGLRLLFQGAEMTSPQGVSGTTNPFSLHIE